MPLGASGAVLNITATEGTAASFVSAWPTGDTQPNASILNVNPGQNLPNMVTVALSADGRLNLFNFAGSVHLIADVAGFLIPGSGGTGPAGPQCPPGPPGPTGIPPQQTLQIGAYAASLPATVSPLTDGCVDFAGGAADFVRLDLSLPLGADITAVRVRYQDTSATGALAASVHMVTFTAGTIQDSILGPAVSSAPPPAVGMLNLDLGGDPEAVIATRIYYINVNVATTAAPGSTRFCGASVDYTLT